MKLLATLKQSYKIQRKKYFRCYSNLRLWPYSDSSSLVSGNNFCSEVGAGRPFLCACFRSLDAFWRWSWGKLAQTWLITLQNNGKYKSTSLRFFVWARWGEDDSCGHFLWASMGAYSQPSLRDEWERANAIATVSGSLLFCLNWQEHPLMICFGLTTSGTPLQRHSDFSSISPKKSDMLLL